MQSFLKQKKSSPDYYEPLERLEREANDDFAMLDELGPTHFGTEHLIELRAAARDRIETFDRRQKLAMMLGGLSAGWVILGFVCSQFRWFWAALAAHGMAAVSLCGFLAILFFLKKKFESRGELEFALREIETELRRRARAKS